MPRKPFSAALYLAARKVPSAIPCRTQTLSTLVPWVNGTSITPWRWGEGLGSRAVTGLLDDCRLVKPNPGELVLEGLDDTSPNPRKLPPMDGPIRGDGATDERQDPGAEDERRLVA